MVSTFLISTMQGEERARITIDAASVDLSEQNIFARDGLGKTVAHIRLQPDFRGKVIASQGDAVAPAAEPAFPDGQVENKEEAPNVL